MHKSKTFYEWACEDVCVVVGGIKKGNSVFCLDQFFECVCVAFN